jgi:2'-5' RNA ligase
VFSVELLPDAGIEAAIRAEWERLIEAGLPSAGRHSGFSNRPHLTLAVRDQLDAPQVAGLAGLAAALPLPLELDGILLFGGAERVILARHVVVTAALREFHAAVAEWLGPPEPRYASTASDHWSPHVTLARRIDAAQLSDALRAVDVRPLRGAATALRIWDAATRTVTMLE